MGVNISLPQHVPADDRPRLVADAVLIRRRAVGLMIVNPLDPPTVQVIVWARHTRENHVVNKLAAAEIVILPFDEQEVVDERVELDGLANDVARLVRHRDFHPIILVGFQGWQGHRPFRVRAGDGQLAGNVRAVKLDLNARGGHADGRGMHDKTRDGGGRKKTGAVGGCDIRDIGGQHLEKFRRCKGGV